MRLNNLHCCWNSARGTFLCWWESSLPPLSLSTHHTSVSATACLRVTTVSVLSASLRPVGGLKSDSVFCGTTGYDRSLRKIIPQLSKNVSGPFCYSSKLMSPFQPRTVMNCYIFLLVNTTLLITGKVPFFIFNFHDWFEFL